jgi:molecular chaperone DnaK
MELMNRFRNEAGLDLSGDRLALQRLKEASEKAKCELSALTTTEINLPFIAADATGPKHLVTTLTRPELEGIIGEIVNRTRKPCEEALGIAGISPQDIDEVLLVGGQARTPLVIQAVREIFHKEPRRDKNPDEVVALGATLQAGIMMGDVKEIVLLDAIPLSLGVTTKGNMFVKLIERGSAIPTKKSRVFTTVADNQDTVEIHVLQGERELASENISLGKFQLVGIPAAPKGLPQIEVTFDINANGIVSVHAKDMITSNEQKIVVNPSSGLSEEEIQRIVSDAHAKEEEDRKLVEIQKLKLKLERLLENNLKAFKEFGSLLDAEKQAEIEGVLKDAQKNLTADNFSRMSESMEQLSTASRILSEVILYNPNATLGGPQQ